MEGRGENRMDRASACSDVSEAVKAYRLWRLVDGELRAQTNDAVWPRGYALAAEVHSSPLYWGLGSRGLTILLAIIVVTVAVQSVVFTGVVKLAATLSYAPQWLVTLAGRPFDTGVVGGLLGVLCAGLAWMSVLGYPLLLSHVAKRSGRTVVEGANTPGGLRDAQALRRPGR